MRSIEGRAKKALLFNLLTEVGYITAKIQKVAYSNPELKDRLVAAIRADKLEIQKLKEELKKAERKYLENLDSLFDALRKLKGTVI